MTDSGLLQSRFVGERWHLLINLRSSACQASFRWLSPFWNFSHNIDHKISIFFFVCHNCGSVVVICRLLMKKIKHLSEWVLYQFLSVSFQLILYSCLYKVHLTRSVQGAVKVVVRSSLWTAMRCFLNVPQFNKNHASWFNCLIQFSQFKFVVKLRIIVSLGLSCDWIDLLQFRSAPATQSQF